MAPPSNPAATPAATPRCAWAGAGMATAETVNAAAAPSAINVFFMASPFSWGANDVKLCPGKSSTFHLKDQWTARSSGTTKMGQTGRLRCGDTKNSSRPLNAGHDDKRNDGIHGCGRRNLADLLPADEPGAKPQGPARERGRRRFHHEFERQFGR